MPCPFKYNYPQMARESGFQLRKYKEGPLDWRLMGSIEVGDRDQCLEQIDSVLEHLSQAPLGSILESNILEKNIAKYFLLSQFAIQYLLFCRKFLEEMIADLRDSNGSAQLEVATLKRSLSEANNEILQLHKRITQMEAIHEVIFPCHLCTKNFVSNDALNLHISRKHNTNPGQKEDRDTPPVVTASAKEKENDLTLINTIKLELEIKHLKERLNNAERKIKDGNIEHPAVTGSRSEYSPEKLHKPETISVGIQSNLSEVKEMEDRTEVERTQVCENHLQILSLEEKLIELRQWQEEQKLQNSQFIGEINDKLKELSNAMEMSHSKQQDQKNGEIVLSKSNSMEDLISRKVEEITQTTVDKLNYVFEKIEVEYKNKLEEMEAQVSKKPPYQETYGNGDTTLAASEHLSQHAVKELDVSPQLPSSEESSPLSNQTFIKTTSERSETHLKEDNAEQTDASDENVEENNRTSERRAFSEKRNIKLKKIYVAITGKHVIKSLSDVVTNSTTQMIVILSPTNLYYIYRPHPRIKPVTRKESKKIVNARLADLGVNFKITHLPHSTMKHISHDLGERRQKLKEKHPNFYATRNRIKKFVDKLCSSKMPHNAEELIRATRTLNEQNRYAKPQNISPPVSSDEEAVLGPEVKASTPVNTEFKKRLESIFASPIRKPDQVSKAAMDFKAPIPMPRKRRVMFNQPETKLSLSGTESDHNLP